ncbi:MAG: glycolate oxidase subunit GlcE [Pseudomonadota bacterium]
MNKVLEGFRERIRLAVANSAPLRIRGGGSKDWYGESAAGEVLDTRAWTGIVAYEPTELVITARAGTPLVEIEAALDEQGQMLAFEPPHYGGAPTLGGMLAAGLSGPRRQAAGAVRDFVLGTVLMNASGNELHFGGQVMKNVAGYDVSRLLAGSLGTLGLILQASIKVLPKPVAEVTLRIETDQARALRCLNEWGGQALPISASVWDEGRLTLRLSGAAAAVRSARLALGGELVEDASQFWRALRDHEAPFFKRCKEFGLWRLSLPSVAPAFGIDSPQLIEWGGAQRWLNGGADAAWVRAEAARLGGHATLFRRAQHSADRFQSLAPPMAALHQRLKHSFDPAGIFNPGRLYKDF